MDPYGYQIAAAVGTHVLKRTFDNAFDATTMYRRPQRAHRRMGPGAAGPRRILDVGAGYQQLHEGRSYRSGRRASRRAIERKALAAQLLTKIDRWQGFTSVTSTNGFYPLTADLTAGIQALPYYVFDLTALQSNIVGTASFYGLPMYRLQRRNATGAWEWVNYSGVTRDGVTTNAGAWDVERQPYTTVQANSPYEKAMLNWCDIRLMLTGSSKWPSRVDVQVVRFIDDERCPPARFINGVGATEALYDPPIATDKAYAEYSRFWQGEVDKLVGNPLVVRGQTHDTFGKKVLFSKSFEFQPTLTSENDAIGHQKTCKIFHQINKIISYKYPTESGAGDLLPPTVQTNVNAFCAENVVNACQVYPEHRAARQFLLIKGFCAATTVAGTGDYPSFDLMVRRKMTVI